MAKRHHSSKRAQHHEHMGMEKYERGPVKHEGMHGHYAGPEARRHEEMRDAGMIHEDHGAIANLPQEVMMKPYPYAGANMPEGLDDTIRGVDHQMNELDDRQRARNNVPKKV